MTSLEQSTARLSLGNDFNSLQSRLKRVDVPSLESPLSQSREGQQRPDSIIGFFLLESQVAKQAFDLRTTEFRGIYKSILLEHENRTGYDTGFDYFLPAQLSQSLTHQQKAIQEIFELRSSVRAFSQAALSQSLFPMVSTSTNSESSGDHTVSGWLAQSQLSLNRFLKSSENQSLLAFMREPMNLHNQERYSVFGYGHSTTAKISQNSNFLTAIKQPKTAEDNVNKLVESIKSDLSKMEENGRMPILPYGIESSTNFSTNVSSGI